MWNHRKCCALCQQIFTSPYWHRTEGLAIGSLWHSRFVKTDTCISTSQAHDHNIKKNAAKTIEHKHGAYFMIFQEWRYVTVHQLIWEGRGGKSSELQWEGGRKSNVLISANKGVVSLPHLFCLSAPAGERGVGSLHCFCPLTGRMELWETWMSLWSSLQQHQVPAFPPSVFTFCLFAECTTWTPFSFLALELNCSHLCFSSPSYRHLIFITHTKTLIQSYLSTSHCLTPLQCPNNSLQGTYWRSGIIIGPGSPTFLQIESYFLGTD